MPLLGYVKWLLVRQRSLNRAYRQHCCEISLAQNCLQVTSLKFWSLDAAIDNFCWYVGRSKISRSSLNKFTLVLSKHAEAWWRMDASVNILSLLQVIGCPVPRHRLNQCCFNHDRNLKYKTQWNLDQDTLFCFQVNAVQNVVYKMETVSYRPRCVGVMDNPHCKQRRCHLHDDVIKWKHFLRYWTFVRGIHRSPVNSPHKGQWALMFSLICVWINGWVNNREAGDLRRCHTHYDAILMWGPFHKCFMVLQFKSF